MVLKYKGRQNLQHLEMRVRKKLYSHCMRLEKSDYSTEFAFPFIGLCMFECLSLLLRFNNGRFNRNIQDGGHRRKNGR